MEKPFDLEAYLSEGMERLVKDVMRATLKSPRESLFLAQYALAAKRAEKRRHALEMEGEHAPSFLIASITEECNLHCTGCYARANAPCAASIAMASSEWARIFREAEDLGVSMILLAGGEPLMRRDVLEQAANQPNIAFPVFTNGTMLDDGYLSLFDAHRNLVPIISIEGGRSLTDARRGDGVFEETLRAMGELRKRDLLFGASITVTRDNMETVTAPSFVEDLHQKGCKVVLFIEYVPVEKRHLALEVPEQEQLARRIAALRAGEEEMIVVSFPGDEKEAEGCLAAGRGFFHINATGGAEPCPFSPYSDTSLRNVSLREALQSPLFARLNSGDLMKKEHTGGCVLFEQEAEVKQLLAPVATIKEC